MISATSVPVSVPKANAPLQEWEQYLEQRNSHTIELGLSRVRQVYQAMALAPLCPVITVAGTNGKGSCVHLLASILQQSGHTVFTHTSPHLLRINERFQRNNQPLDDDELTQAFAAIKAAAGPALTHFEFLVLAALWLIHHIQPDIVVLEVGLGGRLDAVNVVDATVAIITNIALDHQDFLGGTREAIGAEKAGIMRRQQPVISGEPQPPHSVREHAQAVGAQLLVAGEAFTVEQVADRWSWRSAQHQFTDLPLPAIRTPLANAAAVIAALMQLPDALQPNEHAIRAGLAQATLLGRFQQFPPSAVCAAERIVDVAHNPAAAAALAARLAEWPVVGRTIAVLAMQANKDHVAVIQALTAHCSHWFLAGVDQDVAGARQFSATALAATVQQSGVLRSDEWSAHATIAAAYAAAVAAAQPGDRIVIFGSFLTVAAVLPLLQQEWGDKEKQVG